MSGKYNKQHPERTRSNYPERLAARGLSKAPRMRDVDDLRRLQNRRIEQTGSPFPLNREEALLYDIFSKQEGAA